MADYEIHSVVGDEPYVTLHGDFSADRLHEILEEMLETKSAQHHAHLTQAGSGNQADELQPPAQVA